jgi:peroxiredoxin
VDPADVAVVGLDVSDDPEAARSFAAEFNMPYPSIVDSSGSLLSSLPGVPPKAIPSTLIVDRNGRVAARIIGAADPAELSRIVADVVAEWPPA